MKTCLDLVTGRKPVSIVVVGYDHEGMVFTVGTPDLRTADAYLLLDRAKHVINNSDLDVEDDDDDQ